MKPYHGVLAAAMAVLAVGFWRLGLSSLEAVGWGLVLVVSTPVAIGAGVLWWADAEGYRA